MLGELHGTCFVNVDMAAANAYHSLILIQHRVDGSGIGLCASREEENLCVGQSAGFAYEVFGAFREFVEAIGGGVGVVVLYEVLQHQRVRTVVVITFKRQFHGF